MSDWEIINRRNKETVLKELELFREIVDLLRQATIECLSHEPDDQFGISSEKRVLQISQALHAFDESTLQMDIQINDRLILTLTLKGTDK